MGRIYRLFNMFKPNIKPKQKNYKNIQLRLDGSKAETRKAIAVEEHEYELFKTLIAKHYDLGVSPFFRQVIKQTVDQLNA